MLILGICACEKEDPKMRQQQTELALAESFMEAGNYESAIGVLNSMEIYREISGKIAEAEQGYQAQKIAESSWLFENTWYAVDGDMQVTFLREPEPTGEWMMAYVIPVGQGSTALNRQGKIPFTFMGDVCVLEYFTDFQTFYVPQMPVDPYQKDGKTILRLAGMEFATEKTEPQEVVIPVDMVEITMDNWQEYFEIKTYDCWKQDDFGENSDLVLVTYVALKDEYIERIDLEQSDVAVGYAYGWDLMNICLDWQTATYELTRVKSTYGEERETFKLPAKLGRTGMELPDYVGGYFGMPYDPIMNVIGVAKDYRITKIAGTLAIRQN